MKLAIAVICTGIFGCAAPAPTPANNSLLRLAEGLKTWNAATLQLKQGMTEEDVIEILGQPSFTGIQSFFPRNEKAWQGKVWHYWPGGAPRSVVFARLDGRYLLNHW